MTVTDALQIIDRLPSNHPLFDAALKARELLESTDARHFDGDETDPPADAASLCDIYAIRHTHLSSRRFVTYGFPESIDTFRSADRVHLYSIKENGWSIVIATSNDSSLLLGCLVTLKP